MEENDKYTTIKKLVEINGSKERAAIHLNCTIRHVNRMIKGYKEKGKEYFVHGNRGKNPIHTLEDETQKMILDLYRTKYEDANFTHYSELLEKNEKIKVSTSTIRSILMQEYILSPKAKRVTRKREVNRLKELQKSTKFKKEAISLNNTIINIEDAHPRRPRCSYAGEMLKMDASLHNWFGKDKYQLHIAVDDATGTIVGAYFDYQETLNGYLYMVDYNIIIYYT